MAATYSIVLGLTAGRSVIAKLLGFSFAMITLPISSYFMSVNMLFGGRL